MPDSPSWHAQLADFLRPRTVVVGIGNRLCGDDAFGPALIDRLKGTVPFDLWDAGISPEGDVGRIAALNPDSVLLADALAWGAPPGEIGFFLASNLPWQGVSTHALSLQLVVEHMAVRLDGPVALIGVQPAQVQFGSPLNDGANEALNAVARCIIEVGERLRGAAAERGQ